MYNFNRLLLIFSLLIFSLMGSAQTFNYVYPTGWNYIGVPDTISLAPNGNSINSTSLANINFLLPEQKENLTYVDYSNLSIINVDQPTKFWVSIIYEGAGNKNTLSYYTYNGNQPTASETVDLNVIFPNASMINLGGGLHNGDSVYIGEFDNVSTSNLLNMGFCLTANGWNGSSVVESRTKFFSNIDWNPESTETYRAHTVVFWDNTVKKFVLGFEDLVRPNGDNDFNDCLFYITMDPLPAFAREDNPNPGTTPPTLPVELVNFEATYSNSNIILNWVTASEYNNEGFEIQRAGDDLVFETIGYQKGNGNANVLIRYTFVDTEIEEGKTYYYRLKQIDYDGQFKYSSTQTAQIAPSKLMLSAYPNPVGNGERINFKLSSDEKGGNGTINFYSIDGQLIFSKDINYFGLKYYDQISTQGMKSGMYILEFRNKFQTIQNKIIVR